MIDKSALIAVVLVFGMLALAERLGLSRPDSSKWQTCLFYAVLGVVFLLTVDVLEFGPRGFLADTPLLVALVLIGALSGAIAGLWLSYVKRRWPS